MTDTSERAREVAAGLTEQQRFRIRGWPVDRNGWLTCLPSSERREFRGLIERAGYSANRFTMRGLAVRRILEERS